MSEHKKAPSGADVHIGSRIRKRRMLLGMSQEKLGDALGVTFQQVQKYERGTNRISAGRLQCIGEVLGVPAAYFFEGLSDEPKLGNDTEGSVLDILGTNEGFRLARAFASIEDSRLRHKLVELVDAMAKGAMHGEDSAANDR
ncbi:helix-turn-helix domain-containing protein [Microvirga subterranea]|uniref:Transcriptional regulator n=1 Tax=Microvirga subterranea TaxID=186651 RepID=A0A370HP90_9HYPH|nr:helix-turn-helix transcriptional regulator [Microvirga subterranea]RDI60055.1 transcriptional regulator [Microvirga subterranea]